ncbi:DUF6223 family protein [Yinghuangia sp. YIM S09857]|uniref:DUF6223 family protein n=1 Tax=Yinghuangia sp. YIM S09857 TaxID=3436929 RepID=UPI003F52B7C5
MGTSAIRTVVRRVAATAVLTGGLVLAAPAAAHASDHKPAATGVLAAGVTDMSAGRLGASSAAVLALIGTAVGVLALVRPAGRLGTDTGRTGAGTALTAGVVALVLGVVVAVTADGGLGSGNGLGGAYVAMIVGLVSTVLGTLALRRTRERQPTAHRSTAR